ncbi:MAG: hypothetical protein WA057_04490 [Candidatus Magasanikiibacteriota bacterium]
MTNIYAELLEQIIVEMRTALPHEKDLLPGHEYFVWLDFLKKVKPDSKLFIHSNNKIKEYTDIREIMLLAETNHYPAWYIQPHFNEEDIIITYENGELKNISSELTVDMSEVWAVPRQILKFSGVIKGILNAQKSFIAYDLELAGTFLQKKEFLKNAGFTTPEFALFPTAEIASISSNKLETSLINFISQAQQSGLKVDGVIMVSDTPLLSGAVTQIVFIPQTT